jgi:hypothetical protein
LAEKNWQRETFHGRNAQGHLRHDYNNNPELSKMMSSKEVEAAIRNVKPLEDPRPYYLGY